ncbi:MAG: helix-turn-helix transcriptional regulator [Saprospiraceae bacterium]
MPVNRNALVRYHTIDKCLQNRQRKWTLNDLIDACSNALYEYDGIDKPVGRRTIQTDIQTMRSDRLGYNAPIVVLDRKYYAYKDKDYSISKKPLSKSDLKNLSEVMEILKQFKGFSQFEEVTDSIQKLEDKIYSATNESPSIIDFEKNENLKGLVYLDRIYKAINKQKPLTITYQSFTAKRARTFLFHPYLLKEYKNRWFVLGYLDEKQPDYTIALDRIQKLELSDIEYVRNRFFNIQKYYKDIIGVTVNKGLPVQEVRLFVNKISAPYVLTKPIHHSQKVIEEAKDGITISLQLRPNLELEQLILGYGGNIHVLSPPKLKEHVIKKLKKSLEAYSVAG